MFSFWPLTIGAFETEFFSRTSRKIDHHRWVISFTTDRTGSKSFAVYKVSDHHCRPHRYEQKCAKYFFKQRQLSDEERKRTPSSSDTETSISLLETFSQTDCFFSNFVDLNHFLLSAKMDQDGLQTGIFCNTQYIRTIPCILKLVQMVDIHQFSQKMWLLRNILFRSVIYWHWLFVLLASTWKMAGVTKDSSSSWPSPRWSSPWSSLSSIYSMSNRSV